MHKRVLRASLTVFLLLCFALSASADDKAIRDAVTRELDHPSMRHGWTGVCIQSLRDGRTIFARNEDVLLIPASNMKLLVSAVCADVLPADFHYTTPVLRKGEVVDGTLNGDLYLKGTGDSTMENADLRKLAKAVKAAGITRITGDVIGDGSVFDDTRLGSSWSWDYLAAYYAAEIDGLTVDRGCVRVLVKPGAVGESAKVTLEPDCGYVTVSNSAVTVAAGDKDTAVIDRPLGSNTIVVYGNIRAGSAGLDEAVSVREPSLHVAYLFRQFLRDEGIIVDGSARQGATPPNLTKVAEHESPKLGKILDLLNKPSDNLIAESLLKTLGVVKKGKGTADAGAEVEREYLRRIGVPDAEWSIVDGSGLARMNMLTPRAQVKNLRHAWKIPNKDLFVNSLPVAGVAGSIRSRMKGTPAEGNVKAKTGYIGRARTLSGYVTTKDGEPLVFCLMMNHYTGTTSDINAVQDRICTILAGSSTGKVPVARKTK
ncbi:MAG TPA: D-alanyl-D-alanine carboxypeptidase/D-alanyl-D-alanine-endopeptidase [Armatimonadota bacterium]|nr:D-alanyl-D-alanine carboxypeptidase/D-alanyl-D-alanine-endopeptidase [Armatimonadota bacterium]